MSKIGEKIRVRRKNLGLSQERLAERLSVSRQTISSWENGKSAIKLENAKPLSDELKIPLDEFRHEGEPPMNASYNYFLSERIALAACKAIDKNPETPLEKENLVKLQHGNISKENAQKNINTLKKLDILDETGLPTDLGRNWANEITRKDATAIIVQTSFPSGTIQASSLPSKDFVAWIAKNANTPKRASQPFEF